jgi:catechol 2,3-dioxygenase-like lactoylglutathione lyase family enzyme
MGILTDAMPAIVICAKDHEGSKAFYRDILGLELAREDQFAAVFRAGAGTLRVSHVPDFEPHGHTILGFVVPDVAAAVRALGKKGVDFERVPAFKQDELGILTLPGGKGCVAWFRDPAGNLLSVTDT